MSSICEHDQNSSVNHIIMAIDFVIVHVFMFPKTLLVCIKCDWLVSYDTNQFAVFVLSLIKTPDGNDVVALIHCSFARI